MTVEPEGRGWEVLRSTWQAQGLAWPQRQLRPLLEQAAFRVALDFSPFLQREMERQARAFAQDPACWTRADWQPDYPALWRHWQPEQPMAVRLRRFRRFHSAVLALRDLAGLDAVPLTLERLSLLAECLIENALAHCETELAESFGWPQDGRGRRQRMSVLGMGKLGGRELNFSSDIDLIFCYASGGRTDGRRSLDNEQWYLRLGQQLIRLLDEVTGEGFVYRVDMRLRPYGKAGRLVLNHAAMETYYETQGRMWERYALIKARTVAGDRRAGQALLERLQPFIYRRYLDYTALEELADMKRAIHAQYADRRLQDNIKLGPGGIREVEFIVQSFQLIRGGRVQALRQPPLEAALTELVCQKWLDEAQAGGLRAAYRYLRRLENHLQARDDSQTQTLPQDDQQRHRLALSMGHGDWSVLLAELGRHRRQVNAIFARIFQQEEDPDDPWRALASRLMLALDEDEDCLPLLAEAGFDPAEVPAGRLRRWWRSPAFRRLSPRGRQRLEGLMPHLLCAASQADRPAHALSVLVELVQAVALRSAYLALLQTHHQALHWLQDQLLASEWIRRQLLEYPLLLDELLHWQTHARLEPPRQWRQDLQRMLAALPPDDEEQAMVVLRQFSLSRKLQIAVLQLQDRLSAVEAAAQLTRLAEVVLLETLELARRQIVQRHGRLPGVGPLRMLAYGSLAAEMLHYGSDLDLVFLYHGGDDAAVSDGHRPLQAVVYQLRLAQRFVHLLTTRTTAGQLYEIDLRLRPNGNAGLLVSTFSAFARYQRQESWTWEQQALVKARLLGDAPELIEGFEALRAEVLGRRRDERQLRQDICDMRARIRKEKPPPAAGFHLKNSPGGLVDLDFLLQFAVLAYGGSKPALLQPRTLAQLIDATGRCGLLSQPDQKALVQVLECYLEHLHLYHLQGRDPVLDDAPISSGAVTALWQDWLDCASVTEA